jgi:hypothetical protein
MGAPSVVVRLVLGQDQPQVSFAEDQRPVGDLRPGGEYEPFGIGVRPAASGRDLRGPDTGAGQGRVERCGELPGPDANQEREVGGAIAEVHKEIADLLRGPRPVRVRGDPRMCTHRLPTSITHKQYSRPSVMVQSTWKTSQELRCQAAVFSVLAAVFGQAVASS